MYKPSASGIMNAVQYKTPELYAFCEAKLAQRSEYESIRDSRIQKANEALKTEFASANDIITHCNSFPNFKADLEEFLDTQFKDACLWIAH